MNLQILLDPLRRSLIEKIRLRNTHHDMAIFANEYIGQMVFCYGRYEKDELDQTSSVLNELSGGDDYKNGVCLDVGANMGNHTFFYSLLFSSVLSVEPNPILAKLIEASILRNGTDNIFFFPVALGSKKGRMTLLFYGDNLGGGSLREDHKIRNLHADVKVELGDDLIRDNLAPDQLVTFIKIDVEGFEDEVLLGLQETIATQKPVIMIELLISDQPEHARNAIRVLSELGYNKAFTLRRKRVSSVNILDAIKRAIAGNQYELVPVDEWDSDTNYLQTYFIHDERLIHSRQD